MTDEARIADGLGGLTQWSSVLSWAGAQRALL